MQGVVYNVHLGKTTLGVYLIDVPSAILCGLPILSISSIPCPLTHTSNMDLVKTDSGTLLLEQPLFSPRPLRVVCIGAGFAGLILAHRIKNDAAASFIDFQIYEKNAGIGGTWFENRYPGAACDVSTLSSLLTVLINVQRFLHTFTRFRLRLTLTGRGSTQRQLKSCSTSTTLQHNSV